MTTACTRLGIGTVQWGTNYGINNHDGIASPPEVCLILDSARRSGVVTLDTAASYGSSEIVIGKHDLTDFRIVTKTPHLGAGPIKAQQVRELETVFSRSLENLVVERVYGLLLHNTSDLFSPGGRQLLKVMQTLQARGKVDRIGVSVYDSDELDAVLEMFTPDIVQLPVNVLDQRLVCDGSIQRLRKMGVEVHARSVFLQGLLLMPLDFLPKYFEPIRCHLERWHLACVQQGVTPTQGALIYVRDSVDVDVCLVGVENSAQFEQCLSDFRCLSRFDAGGLRCDDPAFVNPANWTLG